ncbi:helix-turn-helix transcriptional regulator [Desulfovibrio sp. ZJ200]|uniref:helix-turn-helix domain-containing protein n=1 Tax=Desulfovibrio sp. ZJ200 TaxID=2709792 RepID=UPI0019819372|nr:helix-turn-helix transcriptional regulator [Desulfovibrio sp. ZJ200]
MEIYSMETDTLGARIRLARGKTSQGVFAALIGVSKGSLGGYERDENLPNTDVALKICQKTGFSVEWLLSGRGPLRAPAAPAAPQKQEAEPPAAAPAAPPAEPPETQKSAPYCARCLKLEEKLEKLEEERRELNAENRRLWKENSALNARVARLEEQQKKGEPARIAAQNYSAA